MDCHKRVGYFSEPHSILLSNSDQWGQDHVDMSMSLSMSMFMSMSEHHSILLKTGLCSSLILIIICKIIIIIIKPSVRSPCKYFVTPTTFQSIVQQILPVSFEYSVFSHCSVAVLQDVWGHQGQFRVSPAWDVSEHWGMFIPRLRLRVHSAGARQVAAADFVWRHQGRHYRWKI